MSAGQIIQHGWVIVEIKNVERQRKTYSAVPLNDTLQQNKKQQLLEKHKLFPRIYKNKQIYTIARTVC